MAQLRFKQLEMGSNFIFREEGIILKDDNGDDEYVLRILDGELRVVPFNKSAIRRQNIGNLLNDRC